MRAPISVIIPTLNAGSDLPDCFAALFEGLTAELIREVIVTDGGSEDETRRVADAAGANWISGPASRGGQLRRGAELAKGDWLLFLHADTVLASGWTFPVGEHMELEHAAYFNLEFAAHGFWPWLVSSWANLRSRALSLPYGDQGLLIRKDLYEQVGGYRDIPLMEDVAMAQALRGRLTNLPVTARTSAARYRRDGWIRRGSRNLLVLTKYLRGADPKDLVKTYRGGSEAGQPGE